MQCNDLNLPLGDDKDHVRVWLLMILIQSPNKVRCIDKPSDVYHDNVAQRKGYKNSCLNGIVPVLERCVDRKQNEQHEIKNPIKSMKKSLNNCNRNDNKCHWPLLKHHKSIFLNVFHVDRFKKFLLSRTQLPNVREDLSMEEIFIAVERIIGRLECLMVEPMNAHPVVDWPLKKTKIVIDRRKWQLEIAVNDMRGVKVQVSRVFIFLFRESFSFSPVLPLFEKSSSRIGGIR